MVDEIRELCRQKNVSVAELERTTGIGSNTLHRWDANAPSINKVKAVADYFGVSIDFLVGREKLITKEEYTLLQMFKELNQEGKESILQYLDFVSQQGKYKKTASA